MSPRPLRVFLLTACILFGLVVLFRWSNIHELEISPNSENHNADLVLSAQWNRIPWEQIPPSKKLVWQSCSPGRQCARLIVPLNHSDPDGEQATIALARVPSSLTDKSEFYRGPILVNPGGPGGSGVDMVLGPGGNLLSTVIGPQFDIVGFDPRGIARSTPRVTFFKTDIERSFWDLGLNVANNSDEGVARTWARGRLIGQLAAENDKGYLKHINTDQTARDMLSIVEAHGKSKLQYWGFSYGTVLGATFASIFPDKIERMIVDGVTDTEDYYAIQWWTSLIDTDKALDSFFGGCAEAGPDVCEFWAPTANDIRRNLTNIYDSVRSKPLPIKLGSTYGLLDYAMLRTTVLRSLFYPYATFPFLSRALSALAAGDGSVLFSQFSPPPFECSCDPLTHLFDSVDDASMAIICNDGDDVPMDLESAEKHLKMMMKVSNWGEIWSAVRINCAGWPKFPKERFRGPFKANTSHPILLIGNTADPVTPLWSAKNVSRGFEGSVVLEQNSTGHCSLSAPSVCTQQYVRRYFEAGTLPPPGTVCEVIGKPFPDAKLPLGMADDQVVLTSGMTLGEREIYGAVLELSKKPIIHFPL